MKNSSYFLSRIERANENFLGSDGVWAADADGDYADGDGFGGQDQLNADGRAKSASKSSSQDSQPYIIMVSNTTSTTVQTVELLNANVGQFTGNISAGCGFTISYGLANITYQQFLASIASGMVFQVGITRLIGINGSSSLAQAQIQETITITTKDINGNAVVRPFIPVIDNYQFQLTQVDIRYDYLVNGLTSLTIANLYGITSGVSSVKVLLYPAKKTNQFKQLQGGATTNYRSPNLDPALKAK